MTIHSILKLICRSDKHPANKKWGGNASHLTVTHINFYEASERIP